MLQSIDHESILKSGYRDFNFDGIDVKVVRELHRFMVRLRKCEEALVEEYHPADEIKCPVHFCIGQEAVSAALSILLRSEDYLFSHHRSHGYYLAKGCSMQELFAELYGRATGANGGKAGSQDISSSKNRFYSGAILSGSIAIATGTALGIQQQRDENLSVAAFGEGATDEGVFWEAVSYAVLKKLPVVLVCENNKYATVSPQQKRQKHLNICERANSFGIQSEAIFGNDVSAVYKKLKNVFDHVRSGNGPFLLETYTYRWNGHVGPEDDSHINYRTADEIKFWTDRCPIRLLEEHYPGRDALLDAADYEAIEKEIETAFAFAKTSEWPTVENWKDENYSAASPVADKLLRELAPKGFDQKQDEAIPGPY
jgi:TPP-dependent pyruvate/acetoin dehydrogenase alpha subunit